MKSIGPYVMARASSGDGAATPPPGGAALPLWATDRLTGIPVLLQPLALALNTLPALPEHPALLAPTDLLSLPGEGEFVVTELPLQAVPATDARLAARGALQALDALHRRGLVHGQVSAAHLWSVDGQVRLSGAGLPTPAAPADDLRALAQALDALGGLPAGLEVLRSAPGTLSAGEALRRLSWGGNQTAQPQETQSPKSQPQAVRPQDPSAAKDRPAGEQAQEAPQGNGTSPAAPAPAVPTAVAPLPVVPPPAAAVPAASLTAQVFDLGPTRAGLATPEQAATGQAATAPETQLPEVLATTEALPAQAPPTPAGLPDRANSGSGEVVVIATAAPELTTQTPATPEPAEVPRTVAPASAARRGAGEKARQRLRADAARAERRAAALEAKAAASAVAEPGASDAAPGSPADPVAGDPATGEPGPQPGSPAADPAPQGVTPQERRRRMQAAAAAEAQAQAAAPTLPRPARPPEPEAGPKQAAPRRDLRPMRLRWNEASGTAGAGWQRRAEGTDAAPGRSVGAASLGAGLGRWRWPVLAAAVLVLLLGAVWAWGQGRAPQAGAGAACCSVRFELSGAAPASGVRLTLAQAPAGAALQPGAALGTAPGTVRLPAAGTYRVRVAAEGFTPETVSVTVPVSAPVRIELGR